MSADGADKNFGPVSIMIPNTDIKSIVWFRSNEVLKTLT